MDFAAVNARLNDLPSTFTRDGPPYTQLIESIGTELTTFTDAADATMSQVLNDDMALDGWLDVWGLLWGVPRIQNEANSTFNTRIARTVLAWVGTLPALQQWMNFYAPGGIVTENPSGLGYALQFPATMTLFAIQVFIAALNRIRPAGVPFTISQIGIGLYLGTESFLNTGAPKGAYLTAGTVPVPLNIGDSTPNSLPLLPSLYFQDPTLNPSLAQ